MKTTYKGAAILFATLLAAVLLGGCSGGKIPDGMDKEKLKSDAVAMIDAMNARDYDAMAAMYDPAAGLSAEDWAATMDPTLNALGAFKQLNGEPSFTTTEDDTYGTIISVFWEAEYENQKVVVQVVFGTDYTVVGLWFR